MRVLLALLMDRILLIGQFCTYMCHPRPDVSTNAIQITFFGKKSFTVRTYVPFRGRQMNREKIKSSLILTSSRRLEVLVITQ
jgi:translation initiation factor IF-3